jgi:glycosyltransferase involved in cell wall biosynthesis
MNRKRSKVQSLRIFICPVGDSLNLHNETGSNGQLSYEYLRNLSKALPNADIFAVAMNNFNVKSFGRVNIKSIFTKKFNRKGFYSLFFYIYTYFRYSRSSEYIDSNIVQHLLPFAPGYSFNLFFIFKNKHKKYVLGPILGPHTKLVDMSDEQGSPNKITKRFGHLIFRYLSKKTISNADLVLFPDRYSYESFKDYLDSKQKYEIIGFGISSDIHKIKHYSRNNFLKVLFVGRLTKRKGCEYLIKAINSGKLRSKVEVSIIGSGPQFDNLKELVHKYELTNTVKFIGSFKGNDEINNAYNRADVVVLPSLSDTWMSAKEALTCGKPVITTSIASHSEHIHNGKNGYLVKPKNYKSIASYLTKLSDDPKLLHRMSTDAYKNSISNYDWQKLSKDYARAITSLLKD